MARRVVIGYQQDGTVDLRVSLPGVDALTADVNGGGFSFSATWSDVVKVYQVGVVSYAASGCKRYDSTGVPNFFEDGYGALYPSLGYKPFVETRRVTASNVVYDDYWDAGQKYGSNAFIWRDCWHARMGTPGSSTDKALYIVYPIAQPIQNGTW